MDISDLISPESVTANLRVTSKKQALQELAKRAAELTGQPERALFEVARLETPIDFDAIDEQPVDLIFVLLAPETAGADHLKALARVSRLFRDRSVCDKLRGTDSNEAIYALLTQSPASHAA